MNLKSVFEENGLLGLVFVPLCWIRGHKFNGARRCIVCHEEKDSRKRYPFSYNKAIIECSIGHKTRIDERSENIIDVGNRWKCPHYNGDCMMPARRIIYEVD